MQVISTIVPIFVIIFIGWTVRHRGYMQAAFLEAANRLVFYLAIPALVFKAIAGASLDTAFNGYLLAGTLGSVLLVAAVVWCFGRCIGLSSPRMAALIQGATHGNLGYIGLAVAYYYIGEAGFAVASIIAGFMIILQNTLSVTVLQIYAEGGAVRTGPGSVAIKIIGNPIIVSALLGIGFSTSGHALPIIVERSLSILSGLALPMALLIIGASLSFRMIRDHWAIVLAVTVFKLIILPSVGVLMYRVLGLPSDTFLPGLILLASPTATVAYVMAREMHGDVDLAVVAISASTIMSAFTFLVWLNWAG